MGSFHSSMAGSYFPYWSRGQVVFMIGRRTPWTPDHEWEKSKYKKLAVRNDRNNDHVAPCIRNDVLYNEDVLLTRPERVIITEGVTDCISLMEHGFPVVSPVTVQIREADWERLLPKLDRRQDGLHLPGQRGLGRGPQWGVAHGARPGRARHPHARGRTTAWGKTAARPARTEGQLRCGCRRRPARHGQAPGGPHRGRHRTRRSAPGRRQDRRKRVLRRR